METINDRYRQATCMRTEKQLKTPVHTVGTQAQSHVRRQVYTIT